MSSSHLPVALLAASYPPARGGLSLAAARLAGGLATRMPVEVLTPSAELAPGQLEETRDGRLTVVRFGAGDRDTTHRAWFDLLTTRGPYRLLHGVYVSETGFLTAYAARYLNIACLVAARGNDLDRDVFRSDRQAGILHALAHANAVVGVSRDLCRSAVALGATGRVEWIPNGVDTSRFQPVPREEELGPGPVIGFFGEARMKKGLPTLLEGFRLLHAERPGARLLLVGGVRASDRGHFEAFRAAHPDLAAAIFDVGSVAPELLPRYYALTDLLWHPSYQDGLPNAVLEGLACGKLTVGTLVGGIPDILDPSVFPGLLVPPRAPETLVSATLVVLDRRADLEARAREYVISRFSPEAEVEAYMRLYDTLAPY